MEGGESFELDDTSATEADRKNVRRLSCKRRRASAVSPYGETDEPRHAARTGVAVWGEGGEGGGIESEGALFLGECIG